LTFHIIFKVGLSYTKAQKGSLLAALNLLLAIEEPGKVAECHVGGFMFYCLSAAGFTAVCVSDPSDSPADIENILDKTLQLLEEKDPNTLLEEKEPLSLQIRKLAEKNLPSEMARSVVEDLDRSMDLFHRSTKIVFIGLSQAGKTSVYKMFFEKASLEEIKDLIPTFRREIHRPAVDVAKERIIVVDLGGQSQFLPLHLEDPVVFSGASTMIFVVDLQDPARFGEAEQYFSQVGDIIAQQKQKVSVTVLFHKFDPKLQPELLANLTEAMKTVGIALKPLDPVFFFTSIFDQESIEQAIASILFRALPVDAIEQTFTSEVFLDAFKRIIPIYECVSKEHGLQEQKARIILKELSAKIGGELAKRLALRWNQILTEGTSFEKPTDEPLVKVTQMDVVRFELICPLSKEKRDPIYCWVTHGLLVGAAKVLGLGTVERVRTMETDNAPSCVFLAKYRI